ncbi:MAG: thiamine-phosphate kinase [Candidatus Omnitrophica bacterium]|nr:thiamine-phosphate kinase [Candidatus Omnitrophota bacterium]MDD5027477.1 thiamine-phosphate kinase [Candidatus Omnitrophota bacterium]MDD5662405.1 thiamine-phosphate kinase [Candidatus Omnitrophota bacterium]
MRRVKDIGEFGLIERFRKSIRTDPSVIKASGDDCAVLKLDKLNYQLFTCDMLVEDVDFTLRDKPYLIGRKAIAVSLSDIAACAGQGRYCLISLGLPKDAPLKFADELFKGMRDISRKYKVNIAGGDLSRSNKIIIDVSMLGQVEKKRLVLRDGARSGDIIFMTGELQGPASGKHLKFTPRLKEARFLARNFKINAMIDISDGLVQDLRHILDKSAVGAVVYEDLIPLSKGVRNLSAALNSGEEFELLFTLPRREARKLFRRKAADFKPIGEIMPRQYGFKLIDKKKRLINIAPRGFKHF